MTAPEHAGHLGGASAGDWLLADVPPAALFVAAFAYAAVLAGQSGERTPPTRVVAWYAGLGVIGVALFSPLGAHGGGHSLSAHMLQHELLLTVAPLLLVTGLDEPVRSALTATARRTGLGRGGLVVLGSPVVATSLWVAVTLGWHLVPVHDAADGPGVALVRSGSLVAAGVVFWVVVGGVLSGRGATVPQRIAALGVAMAASGVLGAALIWSNAAVYSRYADADPWSGLSPLQDQRLAGVLMMALDMPVLLGALGWVVARWARQHVVTPLPEGARAPWPST